MQIMYDTTQETYGYDRVSYLGIEYEFIDDDTVRLSQPASRLF